MHHGSYAVLRPDGTVLTAGRTDPVLPRSCNKPLQAVGLLELGWEPARPEHLALAAASHSGEDRHTLLVREMLAPLGWDPASLLACPVDPPLSRDRAVEPSRVTMNCSGKHAAMLLTCAVNGWDLGSYLSASHPLQVALRGTVSRLAGEPVRHVVTDGCGAPQHAMTLAGLARGFGALAGSAVGAAMRAHPELVGGTGRDVTTLMQRLPGAVAKDGADGAYAVGLPDGSAVAVKIADGAERARMPVVVACLALLGITGLSDLGAVPVLGGGVPVGAVSVMPGAVG